MIRKVLFTENKTFSSGINEEIVKRTTGLDSVEEIDKAVIDKAVEKIWGSGCFFQRDFSITEYIIGHVYKNVPSVHASSKVSGIVTVEIGD